MANDTKTYMDDRQSLEALVESMPPEEAREYWSYCALSLESGFPGRKLVVYDLKDGRPTGMTLLTLDSMRMSASSGPTIDVLDEGKRHIMTVSMVPSKVPGRDIFLHVPQKFEFRWKGKRSANDKGGVNFAPHYAVLIKSRNKPHLLVDDQTYCVRLNQFREMFPDSPIGY